MMSRFQRIPLFISLIIVSLIFITSSWGEPAIQFFEKEKKVVLTGEISKALGMYDEHLQGAVEYLVCAKGGKEYESIIVVDSTAKEIYEAMLKLGVEKGTAPSYDAAQDKMIPPKGTGVLLFVEWTANGETKRVRAEELLYNVRTQKPMEPVAWTFSGSQMVYDLENEKEDVMIPQAFMSHDIVALNYLDGSALFQNPLPESAKENTYKKNDNLVPPLGTRVKLTIEVSQKMQLYILISGRVQGVGFRDFTRQNAMRLGIRGYAKNLPNDKVEVVAEGEKAVLDQLVTLLRKGSPAAQVDDVKIEARPFSGTYTTFEIRY